MENIKKIETALINKKVKKYKIIELVSKKLWYKETFNNIFYDDIKLVEYFIMFEFNEKIFKLNVPSINNLKEIEDLVENCLQNFTGIKINWIENEDMETILKDSFKKIYFENFDSKKIINLIKQEFENIKKILNFSLNTSYSIKVNRYRLLTNSKFSEQYYLSSDLLSMENSRFQKIAHISNIFLDKNFSDKIVREFNKERYEFNPEIKLEGSVLIKKNAFKHIIRNYIQGFYADNIYCNQSFISKNDISKKISDKKFDIISCPFEDIRFDLDGNTVTEKAIISNGKILNFLSNNDYSRYLNINSTGNTDLIDRQRISHQRLKFILKDDKINNLKEFITISDFESFSVDLVTETFSAIAVCKKNDNKFCLPVNFNFKDIFNNIYRIDSNYEWIDNIYCIDVLYKF